MRQRRYAPRAREHEGRGYWRGETWTNFITACEVVTVARPSDVAALLF